MYRVTKWHISFSKQKNHDNHISAIEILTAQLLYFTVQMCKCYVYELLLLKKQSGKSSETKNKKREKKPSVDSHHTTTSLLNFPFIVHAAACGTSTTTKESCINESFTSYLFLSFA